MDTDPTPIAQDLNPTHRMCELPPFVHARIAIRATAEQRPGSSVRDHQSGLLMFAVNEENMMLKLMLIRSSSLVFASTECWR